MKLKIRPPIFFLRRLLRSARKSPCLLPYQRQAATRPPQAPIFFPDSEDRDLSVGEVSVPMDATNKSYGRFKLSFFKTFWDFPYFYNSGFRKIYVSVLQKKTCVLPVLLFCAKLLAHTDDLAFFLALSLSVSCYIC